MQEYSNLDPSNIHLKTIDCFEIHQPKNDGKLASLLDLLDIVKEANSLSRVLISIEYVVFLVKWD